MLTINNFVKHCHSQHTHECPRNSMSCTVGGNNHLGVGLCAYPIKVTTYDCERLIKNEVLKLIAEKLQRRNKRSLYSFGIHDTIFDMPFLVSYLIPLGSSKIPLLFDFIFLKRDRSVFLFKLDICLFFYFISPIYVIPQETYQKEGENNKIQHQLLFFNSFKLNFYLAVLF